MKIHLIYLIDTKKLGAVILLRAFYRLGFTNSFSFFDENRWRRVVEAFYGLKRNGFVW